MAVIIPYGDTNAHGSLGGSLSFRRRFGRVVLQKKPYPVQPNSAGQIAQRDAFKQAGLDYYSYPVLSKRYYDSRAPQLAWTPRNLYIHASLTGILPSQVNVPVKEMLNAQIISTVGAGPSDNAYTFQAVRTSPFYSKNLCTIYDNQNTFSSLGPATVLVDYFRMTWTQTVNIPFRYGIYIQWKNWDDSVHEGIIRFLEETGPSGGKVISADSSMFDSQSLVNLYATNNF